MKAFWITIISDFFQFVYEVRITVEKEEFNFSQQMQMMFSLLHYFQLQSIYLSCLEQSAYNSQIIKIQAKLALITRPYKYFGDQSEMIMFYFAIPLTIYIILTANLMWIKIKYYQGQDLIMKQYQNIQPISQYLVKTFVLIGIIFQSFLYINFIELSLYSFYNTYNNIEYIYIGVFSFISILITLLLQLLSTKYCDIFIFKLNLAKFHSSNTDYLQQLLVGLLILTTKAQLKNQSIMAGILIIFIYIIKLKDIYFNYQKFIYLLRFELFILSFCLTFAIILTIGDIQSNNQNQAYLIFSLLSYPVINKILLNLLDSNLNRIFQKQNNINIQHFKIQQINLFMGCLKNEQNNYTKIILLINTYDKKIQDVQKLKKEQLVYYWFVKENDVFYHKIIDMKDENLKLLYYVQFIKLNFIRKVVEIEQEQKYSEGKLDCSNKQIILQQVLHQSLFRNKILKYVDIRFKNLGILENLKLQLMKKSTINQFLLTNNKEQEEMEQIIGLFISFEQKNQQILENLSIAINLKLQFQNHIQTKNIKTFFKTSFETVKQLYQIEQQMISHYDSFPSQKIQTYLIFYFAEIQNDILGAYQFSNINAMTEGNLVKLKMKMNRSSDIMSQDIQYLTLILDEEKYTFIIEKFSKGLSNVLFQENQQNTLNDILPLGLQSIHVEYIEGFLLTGRSKYFRQFSKAFYRGQNKYLAQIDAVFDFLKNDSNPSYVVFLRQIQIKNPHIWVDQYLNISGITEDINDIFQIPKKFQNQFLNNIDMKPIQQLIPQFNFMVERNRKQDVFNNQTEFTTKPFLKDVQGVCNKIYICEILINVRTSPSDIQYFIIEIFNCKPKIQEIQQEQIQNDIIEEQPILYNSTQYQIFPNKITQNAYSQFDTNIQLSQLNSPRTDISMIKDKNWDLKADIINQHTPQIEEVDQQSIKQGENSRSIKNIAQFEERRSQNIAMNAFAIQSQASSIAGIRSTKYYKRYQIINRFMNGDIKQFEINVVFVILGIVVFIGAIHSVLYLIIILNDLGYINQNMDAISLKPSFSGAQDSYLICFNTIAYHQIQQNMKKITDTQYNEQIKYSAYRLTNIFSQLKINYENIIKNPSLSYYLIDKQLILNQKNGSKIFPINQTIHEAFLLYIESSFGLQNMIEIGSFQLDLSASHIIFQVSNYRVYQNKIQDINNAMIQLSLNKSYEFEDKIHYMFFPNIIVSIIIIALSLYYYLILLKKLERLSKIFNNSFTKYTSLETERLNRLNKDLTYQQRNYQEYKFDIFDNEIELKKLDEKIQFNISNRNQLKQDQRIFIKKYYVIKYICFLFTYLLLYSSFHLINYIQFITYIRKLPNTIQYYDQMVQLHSSSSSLYISRQLTSQISNGLWFFFNDTQKQIFLQSFNDSVTNIQEFLSSYNHIDMNQLLVSQDYVSQYDRFINENLCDQIEQSQLVEWFCDSYIGGSLKRGFITAISGIIFELQNQYQESRGFSQQIITEQSYLEGGLIIGQLIRQICETINKDMQNKTISLSYQIMLINASFLAFFLPVCFIILYKIKQKFDEYFQITLRIITLLPQSFLYLDNQIDGELRQIAILFRI